MKFFQKKTIELYKLKKLPHLRQVEIPLHQMQLQGDPPLHLLIPQDQLPQLDRYRKIHIVMHQIQLVLLHQMDLS